LHLDSSSYRSAVTTKSAFCFFEKTVKTAPSIPTRRALASLAVVTVISTIEKRRKNKAQTEEKEEPPLDIQDMSGELQTIPARHGVATFVPRGRTIKVINTYGKQVVSMWAFTLGAPPEDGDEDGLGDKEIEEEAKKLQEAADREESKGKEDEEEEKKPAGDEKGSKEEEQSEKVSKSEETKDEEEKTEQADTSKDDDAKEEHEDPPEQAPETPENEKTTENTEKSTEGAGKTPKQPSKRTWASYLPSIPYRSKGKGDKADKTGVEQEPSPEEQKAQNEANTKAWSSYIPTGKGFSSYIPNVEVPSKEGVVSAFKSSHYRDPNKSYAEQLYDFSKTPVGAGTIAGKFSQISNIGMLLRNISRHGLRLRLVSLRRLLCLRADTPLQLVPSTNGVPLSTTHARLILQARP
jgi:hypothetical protein